MAGERAGDGREGGFQALMEEWDGLAVVTHVDRPTGTWIFVAVHDDSLGTPTGGCRMRVYEAPAEGMRDAMRLARGMTWKWAALNMPFGGGKSVLAVPRPLEGEERAELFRRFGRLLTSLNGIYATGEDLGTTPEDMAIVAGETRWIAGGDPSSGHPVDPGPFTARGVFEGIRSALRHRVASEELEGRSVLIQGVGDVGEPLARRLAEAGADLVLSDVDADLAARLGAELGAGVVEPGRVYDTACDVFAPCAVGGILNDLTIPRLRCGIVAGSANNQLERESHAGDLHARDILYAPDYVINGGGAMAFGLFSQGMDDVGEVERRVAGIGDSLDLIFAEAVEEGITPVEAAGRRVERVLARARKERAGPP